MPIDWQIAGAGLVVGILIGLTGMGGGSLTTPLLILVFHVRAATAVGTDLMFAAATKWVGAVAHTRQGTVNPGLVRQLAYGSVPSALAGVMLLRALRLRGGTDALVTRFLGGTLILVALLVALDALFARGRSGWVPGLRLPTDRPAVNIAIGAVVGFLLALTSVGSGTLILAALLIAHPGVRSAELVGTDVLHAAILVSVAGLGHLSLGTVNGGILLSLLAGSVPGVLIGSRLALRAPQAVMRPLLAAILFLSGVKLV